MKGKRLQTSWESRGFVLESQWSRRFAAAMSSNMAFQCKIPLIEIKRLQPGFCFLLVIRQSRLCGKGEVHLLCLLTFPSSLKSKAGSYHPEISGREESLTCPLLTRAGNAGEIEADIMPFSGTVQQPQWCTSHEHTLLLHSKRKVILPFPAPSSKPSSAPPLPIEDTKALPSITVESCATEQRRKEGTTRSHYLHLSSQLQQ